MRIKRLLEFASASVLSLSTLMTLGIPLAHAVSYACTWTGAAVVVDHKFSTPGNWSGCNGSAPIAADGDSLIFPVSVTDKAPNNDLLNATFSSVTFNGNAGQSYTSFGVTGNAFTLTGGISDAITSSNGVSIANNITLVGDQTITDSATSSLNLSGSLSGGVANITFNVSNQVGLDGIVSGSGTLLKTGAGYMGLSGANTFTGAFNDTAGTLAVSSSSALGTAAGATTVGPAANFVIGGCYGSLTIPENLTITGLSSQPTGSNVVPKVLVYGGVCAGGVSNATNETYGGQTTTETTYSLTGNISLGSDITFGSYAKSVNLTGALSGNYKVNLLTDYSGALVLGGSSNTTALANGTYNPAAVVKTLADDLPASSVSILKNAEITIDGKRSDVYVESGGTLKGTGTVANLFVNKGSIVAPGHSPGCLSSGNLALAGTYQAEIGGTDPCTGYDQLKVTGTVDLTGSTLSATLYGGFVPKVGQSYTIISNDAADAVTGTFTGIAEGGSYSNQGVTYTVTYKGGDGNDVVLTVTAVDAAAVPKKPDTGFALVTANPLVSFISTTLAAIALVVLARRLNLNTK